MSATTAERTEGTTGEDELRLAQERAQELMQMADILRPAAIRTAATLSLVDHIDAGATGTAELAELTDTRPDLLDMLLRHLVRLGILDRDEHGRYSVTGLGAPLRGSDPAGVRQHLSMDGLFGRTDLALINILHTVRTGEPAHASVFGQGYWETVNEDPRFADAFRQEGPQQLGWGAELIHEAYDWSGVGSVTDVGGNNGTLLIELALRNPHLRGRVLDLKNAAEVAALRFEESGLGDRLTAETGSFFDPITPGSDVYLLSAILADWDDEQAVAILRSVAEAAGADGRVLVADVNIPVEADGPATAGTELYIRAVMPRPVRTVTEIKALAAAAGLEPSWEGPATAVRSLLEFRNA
ncbi:methyltransferase [Streptomyces sp. NPDC006283]|uniref:methyltransferase n=1 Tax=Streptomyces sp. NPDC006283 TaxID=3156741 RepID=UPI00339F5FCD